MPFSQELELPAENYNPEDPLHVQFISDQIEKFKPAHDSLLRDYKKLLASTAATSVSLMMMPTVITLVSCVLTVVVFVNNVPVIPKLDSENQKNIRDLIQLFNAWATLKNVNDEKILDLMEVLVPLKAVVVPLVPEESRSARYQNLYQKFPNYFVDVSLPSSYDLSAKLMNETLDGNRIPYIGFFGNAIAKRIIGSHAARFVSNVYKTVEDETGLLLAGYRNQNELSLAAKLLQWVSEKVSSNVETNNVENESRFRIC